ncbi:hypothetical protein [Finegoldia magna]|uniref:hypothetical protein n=1 Tax=Finegoldia magna TaxID=1260 RepID=UPI00290B00E0|nr:hypothetical protein [Finegoldia magna]MDU7164599.1 hypothetical protein [Finegoldia magna]
MSYFNYWISVLVVFAIIFLFSRTISDEKQIVAFFSKLIYVVIIPANIAISFSNILVMKPFLESVMDKNILNNLMFS